MISGKKSHEFFLNEQGSHCFQRIPPTEKRGRVQTSTITVAVLIEQTDVKIEIKDDDIEMWCTRGSGKGGQHRNTTDSSVFLKHLPTGIVSKSEDERSQHQNRVIAMERLKAKLYELECNRINGNITENRRSQIGAGERSDKRRTYREKDDLVVDHISNKSMRLKDVWKGKIQLLHK